MTEDKGGWSRGSGARCKCTWTRVVLIAEDNSGWSVFIGGG
jgi:hypothetical protein